MGVTDNSSGPDGAHGVLPSGAPGNPHHLFGGAVAAATSEPLGSESGDRPVGDLPGGQGEERPGQRLRRRRQSVQRDQGVIVDEIVLCNSRWDLFECTQGAREIPVEGGAGAGLNHDPILPNRRYTQ